MKGYVYVLTNEAMPGLVKIGRSKHAAGTRAKQIYKGDTGVPLPFEVYFECMFEDCIAGEAYIHEELEEHRINPNREFFRIDPWDAQIAVMRVCAYEVDHTIVAEDFTVCEAQMALVAHKLCVSPPDPYVIVNHISDSAWRDAAAVYHNRRAKNAAESYGAPVLPESVLAGCE